MICSFLEAKKIPKIFFGKVLSIRKDSNSWQSWASSGRHELPSSTSSIRGNQSGYWRENKLSTRGRNAWSDVDQLMWSHGSSRCHPIRRCFACLSSADWPLLIKRVRRPPRSRGRSFSGRKVCSSNERTISGQHQQKPLKSGLTNDAADAAGTVRNASGGSSRWVLITKMSQWVTDN